MDIKNVALLMTPYIHDANLDNDNPEFGHFHLLEMRTKIVNGDVTGEKAHRWLGYIQGVVVSHGGATLEDMKKINSEGKLPLTTY